VEDSFNKCFELLRAGDVEALRQLLVQDSAYAEARDSKGVSLLMQCLYRGHHDLVELIASNKIASKKIAGKNKALDIFEAAALGRLDRLKEIIGDDGVRDPSLINSHSTDGFTALHLSCFFAQPEAARLLIEAGAAVDAVAANPTRVMPLHSAASARNLEAARFLLEHGAPVNARQQAGWVPIHAAAQNGDRPMVELLLKHRADPKLTNDDGKTAAMVAREKGHEQIAALL
jgi:ankyrin repeat protein